MATIRGSNKVHHRGSNIRRANYRKGRHRCHEKERAKKVIPTHKRPPIPTRHTTKNIRQTIQTKIHQRLPPLPWETKVHCHRLRNGGDWMGWRCFCWIRLYVFQSVLWNFVPFYIRSSSQEYSCVEYDCSIAALEYRKIANNQSIKELLNKSVCTRNNLLYIDFMMCWWI